MYMTQEWAVESAFVTETFMALDMLEEIAHVEIGIPILCIFHLRACSKERIGFVKEENRFTAFGPPKYSPQIFLRLANVLTGHLREIDCVQIQVPILGHHGGGFLRWRGVEPDSINT